MTEFNQFTFGVKTYADLWRDLQERSRRLAIPIVQEYHELEHVYNLIRDCESYLEVGAAEGNSLYVLSQAVKPWSNIKYIDFGEPHTKDARDEVIQRVGSVGIKITGIHGNSNDQSTLAQLNGERFDAVFIDAGHEYENVKIDSEFYGPLANKYIIYHDICLPGVELAFNEYAKKRTDCESYRIKNSQTFGYGILEVIK
jgi:hypothetical protein